jgi:hypothetical protein
MTVLFINIIANIAYVAKIQEQMSITNNLPEDKEKLYISLFGHI